MKRTARGSLNSPTDKQNNIKIYTKKTYRPRPLIGTVLPQLPRLRPRRDAAVPQSPAYTREEPDSRPRTSAPFPSRPIPRLHPCHVPQTSTMSSPTIYRHHHAFTPFSRRTATRRRETTTTTGVGAARDEIREIVQSGGRRKMNETGRGRKEPTKNRAKNTRTLANELTSLQLGGLSVRSRRRGGGCEAVAVRELGWGKFF
jgi:hypothetical protein